MRLNSQSLCVSDHAPAKRLLHIGKQQREKQSSKIVHANEPHFYDAIGYTPQAMTSTRPATFRPTRTRWLMLSLVSFASASAYLTRYCISAANTTIQRDLDFDDATMGKVMSAFAFGYLICQIPGGWMGNRFGTRIAFALSSAIWSLCNVWSGFAFAFVSLWTSRFFLGVFQAGLTPLSAKILNDWIPLQSRGISSAAIAASMSIGGVSTLALTGWLLSRGFEWRTLFHAYALVGLVWAAGFYWYFRTSPRQHSRVNDAELALIGNTAQGSDENRPPDAGKFEGEHLGSSPITGRAFFAQMLLSLNFWALAIQAFFRAAGYMFFVTWFFAFLEYRFGVNRAQAGVLNSLPLLAVAVGASCGGLLVDALFRRTRSHRLSRSGTAAVALGICSALTLASAWTQSAQQLTVVIAIGAFFSGLGNPCAWAATIDLGGKHAALLMASTNMAGCIAGTVLPTLLGNWFYRIRTVGGDWNQVIYLHAAFYFVAAFSWLLVRPSSPIGEHDGINSVELTFRGHNEKSEPPGNGATLV